MTVIEKPDLANLQSAIKEITKTEKMLCEIAQLYEKEKKQVLAGYEKLQLEAAENELAKMDIEVLSRDKSGIRLQPLREAGIETIGQLMGYSESRLAQINGIGSDSAQKIHSKVQALHTSAFAHAKVRLSPDGKDAWRRDMVLALGKLIAGGNELTMLMNLYETYHQRNVTYLAQAQKIGSSVKWFFAGKDKRESGVSATKFLFGEIEQGIPEKVEEIYTPCREAMKKAMPNDIMAKFSENNAAFYAMLENITGSHASASAVVGNLPEQLVEAINDYELDLSLMKSVLRNYQLFGTKYVLRQRKTLLGDEMGLGKTMQAIAAMAHLSTLGKTHFIVVCPVSVMVNWVREIEKHTHMTAVMIHGQDRDEEYTKWLSEGGIAITTYETITRLELSEWNTIDMLTVDEAHYVKNPKANRTIALQKLASLADYILFMSGTPMENKVEEMTFLISMLSSDLAGKLVNLTTIEKAEEYKAKIAPVYLRRVREDVLKELPELIEKEQWCVLGKEEQQAYKAALKEGSYMAMRKVSWDVPDIQNSSKANRLKELVEQAKEENRRVIVFSFFLDVIQAVQALVGDSCYGPITGGVSAPKRQEMIDEFSQSEPGSVLVAQIIAAGTGLNIQAASMIILCEPQWKPSIENQAIARAYRMGQTQSVVVHRLLADETVDEHILEILQGKSELFDGFADESVVGAADMEMLEREEADKAQEVATADTKEADTIPATTNADSEIDSRKEQSLMKAILESERKKYGVSEAD